ncbi:hypothetical protein RJ640_025841 [Escallonia rubra]|uniref:DNA binding protein n=1 Tax=Escallonia rubra TaxID=112253 RepID=A0AA88QFL9_9ASTE|nr:hypothetical protein RJ640_025841 [Escallonia rubra]
MKRNHLSECVNCGTEERVLIYNVRHRGVFRRLCTTCVLKSHPGSFCPVCFQVYDDDPPPPDKRAICLNCPSISHLSCAAPSPAAGYLCPSCSDPSFSFFNVGRSNKKVKVSDMESVGGGAGREINEDLGKQLVAAAKIALRSINKAAAMAKFDADKRVKEATAARRRAREALAYLVSMEKADDHQQHKVLAGKRVQNPSGHRNNNGPPAAGNGERGEKGSDAQQR